MGPETGTPEVVCQSQNNGIITSGGGFSDQIAVPSWQADSVNYYFTQAVGSAAPKPGYNAGGRGENIELYVEIISSSSSLLFFFF
jgi:hypothetical protein